jgi:uroporphyrinogen-III decarboxylase
MNSRERVLTAFNHEEPDRVPCWCGASPEFWNKLKAATKLDDEGLRRRLGDDFRSINPQYNPPNAQPLSDGASCRTVFGIEHRGIGYGQPTTHPLAAATLDEINNYPWPDPAHVDVSAMRAEAQRHDGQYAILTGPWSPFFHDAIDLMGMEQFYYRMYDEPAAVDAMMTHMTDFYFEMAKRAFNASADVADIFFMGNDLGSMTGPLLGEELFGRFVLPHLRRMIDLGHDYGLKTMLHCCGGFAPLIPSLIDAGLDALHAIQPCCHGMDLAELKKNFGQQIVFNGAIDSTNVLIKGTPDFVRAETRRTLDIMKPGGGYIAGASHDYILPETPVENILAMFDEILEYGRY